MFRAAPSVADVGELRGPTAGRECRGCRQGPHDSVGAPQEALHRLVRRFPTLRLATPRAGPAHHHTAQLLPRRPPRHWVSPDHRVTATVPAAPGRGGRTKNRHRLANSWQATSSG